MADVPSASGNLDTIFTPKPASHWWTYCAPTLNSYVHAPEWLENPVACHPDPGRPVCLPKSMDPSLGRVQVEAVSHFS